MFSKRILKEGVVEGHKIEIIKYKYLSKVKPFEKLRISPNFIYVICIYVLIN